MKLKIACRARKMGNWDKKSYWNELHREMNQYSASMPKDWEDRYQDEYDPSEWETKELFIGDNWWYDQESKCVEEREGWICDEDSGNPEKRLNDKGNGGLTDTFKIYRTNPICAWAITPNDNPYNRLGRKMRTEENKWYQDLKITCEDGIKGCGSRQLKDKEPSPWGSLFRIIGSGCSSTGDCVHSNNYPKNYSSGDKCTVIINQQKVSVCRMGNYRVSTGGPLLTLFDFMDQPWFGPYWQWRLIESPVAMPPVLDHVHLNWWARGSTPNMGWQFCFKPHA